MSQSWIYLSMVRKPEEHSALATSTVGWSLAWQFSVLTGTLQLPLRRRQPSCQPDAYGWQTSFALWHSTSATYERGEVKRKEEEEKDQGFRTLLSKEGLSILSTCVSTELVRSMDSQVNSPIRCIRICVCVYGKGSWVVYASMSRCMGACFSTSAHRGQRLIMDIFIYLPTPYFWDRA